MRSIRIVAPETERIIKESLSYDPQTGRIIWLVSRRPTVKVGDEAGCIAANGYRHIRVNRELILGHRLGWFLYHGGWPNGVLDHIDGNPQNNAINNLRECSQQQNSFYQQSRRGASKYKGVSRSYNKWSAEIWKDGVKYSLGRFDCEVEAARAYNLSAMELHGEFALLNEVTT